jgi:hypothetical protein
MKYIEKELFVEKTKYSSEVNITKKRHHAKKMHYNDYLVFISHKKRENLVVYDKIYYKHTKIDAKHGKKLKLPL